MIRPCRLRRTFVRRAVVPLVLAASCAAVGCAPIRPPDGTGGNGRVPVASLARVRLDCWVDAKIADPLRRMIAAANADGVALQPEGYFTTDPIPVSACYRSYDEQVVARDYFCSKGSCETAAAPGTSKHGLGRAVDFRDEKGELSFDSKGYAWLVAHAKEYGFTHPDWAEPQGRNPEPWHWEALTSSA